MKHQKRHPMILLLYFLLVMAPTLTPLLPKSSTIAEAATKTVQTKLQLNKTSKTLYVGETYLLKLVGSAESPSWYSSNPTIASVDDSGLITARKKGTAIITATYKKQTYSCTIKVLAQHIYTQAEEFSCTYTTNLAVYVEDMKLNEKITYEIKDSSILSCKWAGTFGKTNLNLLTITPKKNGTTQIILTSDQAKQKQVITVHVFGFDTAKKDTSTKSSSDALLSATEIYANCFKSTVQINTDVSIGSGFFLDEFTIVTNFHVIEGASSIEVITFDEKTYKVKTILGYDKTHDIALLKISGSYEPLKLNTHGLTIGETVYTIGSPLGFTNTFTNGMVTYDKRYLDSTYYIQTNAAFSSGNSGGPLINEYGEVIGINTLSYVYGQNLNLSIDIAQVLAVDRYHPLTVKEFLEKNPVPTYLEEDATMSVSKETAQELNTNVILVGTTNQETNFIDYYKFVVKEANSYLLEMYTATYTPEELSKLWVGIMDENGQLVDQIVSVNTTFLSEADLAPGTYYILVYPNDKNYKKEDITYYVTLSISDGVG